MSSFPLEMLSTDGILRNNKTLPKLISGNEICAARVCQANPNLSDGVFIKMENYFKVLHSMEKVPWSSFDNMPKENIYIMEELATNISGLRQKIIS